MLYSNITELKRVYSASFDSLISCIEKDVETHADIYDNSNGIAEAIGVLINNTEDFQRIIEKNPELKVGNLLNANITSREIYEADKESGMNKGSLTAVLKLIEKLEKEEEKLAEETEIKTKEEIEKNCIEILNSINAEKTQLRGKVNDFLKFLETAGTLEIKNQ